MKNLTKQDIITLSLFSFGFIIFAFSPTIEDFLLSLILPLPILFYWLGYFIVVVSFFYVYSFFKKKAFSFKFNEDSPSKSILKLIFAGAIVGFLINILNIYVLGMLQMLFFS